MIARSAVALTPPERVLSPLEPVLTYLSVRPMHQFSFNISTMTVPIAEHDERLGVRLAPEVKHAAQRAAMAHGLSLSEWTRLVIERAAAEPPPPPRRPARRPRPGGSPDPG